MKNSLSRLGVLFTVILSLTACHKRPMPKDARLKEYSYNTQMNAHGRHIGGFSRANYIKSSKKAVEQIMKSDMQLINEGHRITLLIPTDKYFIFNTSKLNDLRFAPLSSVVKLVKCFPNSPIYVAGFTDDIGRTEHREQLSQDRAQAMVAYLWAHGVPEAKLNAEGYGSRYDIANNHLIHGSALNRRIEIQWTL